MSLSDFIDCTRAKCCSLWLILAIVPLYHCTGRKSWCLCQILAIIPLYHCTRAKKLMSLSDFSDCTIVPNSKMKKFLNFKTLDSARKHCTIVPDRKHWCLSQILVIVPLYQSKMLLSLTRTTILFSQSVLSQVHMWIIKNVWKSRLISFFFLYKVH